MSAMGDLHYELFGLIGEVREIESEPQYRSRFDYIEAGDCADCEGTGTCHGPTGGATFSTAQQQWYPEEGSWKCPTCHGTGCAPACPQCFGTLIEMHHDLGPYCPACLMHIGEMEVAS